MVNLNQCIILFLIYRYTEPKSSPFWNINKAYHDLHKDILYTYIRDRNFSQNRTIEDNTQYYNQKQIKWKKLVVEHEEAVEKQLMQENKRARRTLRSSMCIMGRTDSFVNSPLATRRKAKNSTPVPVVDNPITEKKVRKGFAKSPQMLTDETDIYYHSYKCNNNARLTIDRDVMKCQDFDPDTPCPINCNCPKACQIEEDMINPWTDIEKLIFILVFFAHPKDFSMISRCLKNKSYQDVVSYYYKSKKIVQYKELLKNLVTNRRKGSYNPTLLVQLACKALGLNVPEEFFRPGLRLEKIVGYLGERSYNSLNTLKSEGYIDTLNRVCRIMFDQESANISVLNTNTKTAKKIKKYSFNRQNALGKNLAKWSIEEKELFITNLPNLKDVYYIIFRIGLKCQILSKQKHLKIVMIFSNIIDINMH